ncbi:hypothetical protein ACTFIZ_010180 [Dictyostelium cf. discoideum]
MATRDITSSYILSRTEFKNRAKIINNTININIKKSGSGYKRLEEENYQDIDIDNNINNNNNNNNNNNINNNNINNNNINNNDNDNDNDNNNNNDIQLNILDTEINIEQLNALPPWIQKLNDIDENIKKIISLIEKFKKYLKEDIDKILAEDIEMESRIDCERSIELLTMETIRLFHKTFDMIKYLNKSNNLSQGENKMKKNSQRMKSAKLKSLLISFKHIQRSYLALLKKVSSLQRSLSSSFLYRSGEYDANNDNEDYGENSSISNSHYHHHHHHHHHNHHHHHEEDHDHEEDHEEIMDELNEMATTLIERQRVSQLIKETSHLIQDVGSMCVKKDSIFDRIDYNLAEGEELEFSGTVLIGDGITNGYERPENEKRKKLLLIFVVLIIVILFIFVLKYLIKI